MYHHTTMVKEGSLSTTQTLNVYAHEHTHTHSSTLAYTE